jgi:hypothetical protein
MQHGVDECCDDGRADEMDRPVKELESEVCRERMID